MDFWAVHSGWFLVLIFFFPRITILLATGAPFGPLHWLGWLVTPRILAAILATYCYGCANPGVVVLAWIFGISGNILSTVVTVMVTNMLIADNKS
jgi:hypothetical protein